MDQTKAKGKNINGDLEAKRLKAKENLAKARAKRLEMLRAKKNAKDNYSDDDSDYSIYSDSESSDSEPLAIVPLQKAKKTVKIANKDKQPDQNELMMQMFTEFMKGKTKQKKRTAKQQPIINNIMVPQAAAPAPVKTEKTKDELFMEELRKRIF